jgi:hypothetical protein
MSWQPIETAPKDGTKIDLWAKIWIAATDTFSEERFPFCYWRKDDNVTGRGAGWVNLNNSYYPTHWMPIPEGPAK